MKINKQNFKNADLMCLDMFKKPVLTEKSVNIEVEQDCMTFIIRPEFNKNHIRLAIEQFFGTKAISVRIINTKTKKKSFRGRPYNKPTFKKCLVRVENMEKVREALSA